MVRRKRERRSSVNGLDEMDLWRRTKDECTSDGTGDWRLRLATGSGAGGYHYLHRATQKAEERVVVE